MAWEASRGKVETGLKTGQLARLPERTFRGAADALQGEEAACSICMCEYEEGEKLTVLPGCTHAFHADCVFQWLESKPTCPACMRDVRTDMGGASA